MNTQPNWDWNSFLFVTKLISVQHLTAICLSLPHIKLYIYILGSDKALGDILTVVQWSSYESFWYMLVTPLEHRTSNCVHIIRDLKSLMCFYSLSVKYTQVLFKPPHGKEHLLNIFILNYFNIYSMYFDLNLLCASIYLHRYWR